MTHCSILSCREDNTCSWGVCNVVTDAARDDCGNPPPVSKETLVTCLRDVFHVTRGPNDITNKDAVRRFIVKHFGNISATVDKAAVEEQRFPAPGQVMVISPQIAKCFDIKSMLL